MANISINIKKFDEQFNNEYEFLYEHHDRVAGYTEAVDAFDDSMKRQQWFRDFVSEFVNYRQDYISSDREAAAFMFALDAMTNEQEA